MDTLVALGYALADSGGRYVPDAQDRIAKPRPRPTGESLDCHMPVPTISLARSQADDLATVCALGSAGIRRIASAIDAAQGTIKPGKIREIIAAQVGKDNAEAVKRVLFGITTASRRGSLSISELLDGLSQSLAARWDEANLEKWQACRPALEGLLASKSMVLATKAADLSSDFERICLAVRVLTDIRPVFDDQKREILGSTITQTLRMEYIAPDGDQQSISVALDMDDLAQLKTACEDAVRKAEIAKKMLGDKIEIIMPGEGME